MIVFVPTRTYLCVPNLKIILLFLQLLRKPNHHPSHPSTTKKKDAESYPKVCRELRCLDCVRGSHWARPVPHTYRPLPQPAEMARLVSISDVLGGPYG